MGCYYPLTFIVTNRLPKKKFTTREITFLALCVAASVVGRLMFQFVPNIQPMTDIFLLLTIYQGLREGWIVSILSVLITSVYLGMGLWTISQMISYSVLIILVYFLGNIKQFKRSFLLQIAFSFLAGFIYGFVISLFESKFYGIQVFWSYYLAGVSFDFMHALGNVGFYLLLYPFFSKRNLLK